MSTRNIIKCDDVNVTIRLFCPFICALMASGNVGASADGAQADLAGDRVIVELKGRLSGRLLADGAAMGQAVIVAASAEGDVPPVGETFLARARSRTLTYRADARRPHGKGWLVTLCRVD